MWSLHQKYFFAFLGLGLFDVILEQVDAQDFLIPISDKYFSYLMAVLLDFRGTS